MGSEGLWPPECTYVRPYVCERTFIRTYVRRMRQQKVEDGAKDWLAKFVKHEWGTGLDHKEAMRLKSLVGRCRKIYHEEERIRAQLRVGRGRGRQVSAVPVCFSNIVNG